MGLWIKNTDGKPDAVLTMTLAGFVVILTKILLSGIVLNAFGRELTFGSIDGAVIGALLAPTLGAYVARRYTDKKHGPDYAKASNLSDEQHETV